jgi:regulator of sirC expression with transglutaminase-like and TPR domain
MTAEQTITRFREIVNQPEDGINLAEAALLIAADEYSDLDIAGYLRRLDDIAGQIRPAIRQDDSPRRKIERLNRYLFQELQFRGNQENYYDPRNSYLNDVIDRRVGLPITLSVIYLEVGRRLGFPLFGVGLPGHFCVKWHDRQDEIFLDPFHAGEILDENSLVNLIEETFHARVQLLPEWLQIVDARYILTRMLNNLRNIFLRTENFERALGVVVKLLVLHPYAKEQLREAGVLSYRVGSYHRAAEFLEDYLLQHPDADDAVHLRTYLHTAWVAIARMN